jgi:histidinol phosphatase-like enzyme
MSETKYVTWEMFEQYHKKLMEYIGMHDDLMLDGFTICPKCGEIMTSDKCERCAKSNEVEE